MERELAPYRSAAAAVTDWTLFGTMISHASYPVIDGGANPATLSHTILTDFLRGTSATAQAFGGKDASGAATKLAAMNFHGITVSDAFWTWGATKGTTSLERQRLMARSFLAGIDILMIAKTDFSGAWGYFEEVYANLLPVAEQQALVKAAGYPSWDALRTAFRARITESVTRIRGVKSKLGPATSAMKTGPATNASTDLVTEYRSLSH
jgi:beta-glucosidase-like glycosyl hydrolase